MESRSLGPPALQSQRRCPRARVQLAALVLEDAKEKDIPAFFFFNPHLDPFPQTPSESRVVYILWFPS